MFLGGGLRGQAIKAPYEFNRMKTRSVVTPSQGLVYLAVLALVSGPAHAAPLTLINPSFETPVNADPLFTGRFSFGESRDFGPNGADDIVEPGDANRITGWTTVTTENATTDGAEISVGFANIAPADGSQAVSLMAGASVSQFTSVAWSSLGAGDTITMTVAVGDRTNTGVPVWADESFFAIIDTATTGTLAAGTLLSSTVGNSGLLTTPFVGGLGINSGSMQDRSFSYTVTASDLSRPGNVGVLLAARGVDGSTGNGLGSTNNQAFFDNVRINVEPAPGGSSPPTSSSSSSTTCVGMPRPSRATRSSQLPTWTPSRHRGRSSRMPSPPPRFAW